MEEVIEKASAENTSQPLGSNEVLDQIEAEALGMTGGPAADQAGTDQPGAQPAPENKPFEQPPGAFEATHEMIVGGIKTVLAKYPGGEEAGKVWESPFFKQAVIPVMVKYNISIHNLPAELVLIGVIVMLAKQTVTILGEHKADATSKEV